MSEVSTAPSEPSTPLLAMLGGLLHDVGKAVVQEAGRDRESTQFECETPQQHAHFAACASCKKRYVYAHAPAGARLLEETLLANFGRLQHLVAHHHADDGSHPALRAVIAGDHFSAGERDEKYDGGSATAALLNALAASDVQVRPQPLSASMLFNAAEPARLGQDYGSLVRDHLRESIATAGRYAGDDWDALADHLCGALYRSSSAVPSAFMKTVADISLASHCHLAGAFAAAMATDQGTATARVGLISGDLSGIQEFVHGVSSKRAARALRARSFYLQVLSVAVARFVARRLGGFGPSVLNASAGNFLIAVGPDRLSELDAVQDELDAILYRFHGSKLSVVLAGEPVAQEEMRDFLAVRRRLSMKLSDAKNRRFSRTAAAVGLFEPSATVPEGAACRSCGRDATGAVDEDGSRLCTFCASLEKLGHQLRSARFLTVEDRVPSRAPAWAEPFAKMGLAVSVEDDAPAAPFPGAIYAFDEAALAEVPCARFLPVGRSVPRDANGDALDFKDIASGRRGRPSLAVAKMDVDDLGVFLQGLGQARNMTPSRFAAVSQALSLFFEGYIDQLAAKDGRNIYMVFAGGDDLLCAGNLHDVLEFVREVRQEFSRWTGGNPALHISCGIDAGRATSPILPALDRAEEALRASKEYRKDRSDAKPAKDAITLFGRTLPWDEFEHVWERRERLIEMVSASGDDRAARSLLGLLKQLDGINDHFGNVIYGPLVPRAYYHLSRFADRNNRPREEMHRMYDDALTPRGGVKMALAARLAELSTATGSQEGDNR